MTLDDRLEQIVKLLGLLVAKEGDQEWYSTAEFADAVGRTPLTVREWCRLTGCNPTHVIEFVNGRRAAPPHDLLAALHLRVDYVRIRKPNASLALGESK